MYQKSTIIPALTVAENLFLNRQSERSMINWRALAGRARELLDTYEVDVDAQALAGDLSVEQRQLVEIARALSFGARFIILDEPTARLDGPAIERLFTRMRSLREQGVTMMYISHHLDEVYEICQSVTVFRDARHVTTRPVADLPHDELVAAMTGEATAVYEARSRTLRERGALGREPRPGRAATPASTSPYGPARSSAWPAWRAAARSGWPRRWSACAGPTPAP